MAESNLTAQRLRELLNYDPETGAFTWKVATGKKAVVGMGLGWVDKDGYWMLGVERRKMRAHRAAWLYVNGTPPSGDIDHINGIRTDNRIANLRDVTRSVNMQNVKRARSDSRCGLIGAEFHRQSGLWMARIKAGEKRLLLGYFKTPEGASEAYLAAKRRLHEGCTI